MERLADEVEEEVEEFDPIPDENRRRYEDLMALFQPYSDYGFEWQSQAACRDQPTAVFYPPTEIEGRQHRATSNVWAQARLVCAACEVKAQCLWFAVDNGEPWGFWGGMTPPERRVAARRHHAAIQRAAKWEAEHAPSTRGD